MISVADYLRFVDDALDEMVAIVEALGDDLANRRLAVPGANSPYAILTHCLGVMECWAGHLVAGRPIERDRDAEFVATGEVRALVGRVHDARRQLRHDLETLVPDAPLRNPPDPEDVDEPFGRRQGAALVHLYRELTQHLGQMQACRDVMTSDGAALAPGETPPHRPAATQRVVLVGGWTGAGKSTLADAIASALGCAVASFDWLMSALRSSPDVWPAIEHPRERQREVGCALISRVVEQELRRGASVVIDFVARQPARERWQALAEAHRAPFAVVECVCSDLAVHRSRVEARSRSIPGWYELDWDHIERGRAAYTPLDEPKLVLDAIDPFDRNVAAALAHITSSARAQ